MKNVFEKLALTLMRCDIGFEVIRTEKALIIHFNNFEGKSFFFVLIKEYDGNSSGLLVFLSNIHKDLIISPTVSETKGSSWEKYLMGKCFCYFSKHRDERITYYGSTEKEINEQNFNTNFVKEINKILKF